MFLLIGAGLYFTVVTRFIQFRHFGHMWKLLRVSNQGRKSGGSTGKMFITIHSGLLLESRKASNNLRRL
ncbi:hypothetical protein R0K04_22740, partial [Pseudoalteromonas sp. SIMBA_153]